MRLSALKGEIRSEGDQRVLVFDCPCSLYGQDGKCFGRIRIPLKPMHNGWDVTAGSTIEDITLQPSVLIHPTGEPNHSRHIHATQHRSSRPGTMARRAPRRFYREG